MSEPIYKTVKDYAERKKVSIKTIHNWIESGRIPKKDIKKVLGTTLIKV